MRKYLTNRVISAVKPNVPKTKLGKAKSELEKAIQKTKGSKAKLKQTLFEIENKQPLTFQSQRGIKTKSNTEKAKIRNEESKKMFKKTMSDNKKVIKNIMRGGKESKKDGGRMGLKDGTPKQNIGKMNRTFNRTKSDLNKDGKLSSYEEKRGMAIAEAMKGKK